MIQSPKSEYFHGVYRSAVLLFPSVTLLVMPVGRTIFLGYDLDPVMKLFFTEISDNPSRSRAKREIHTIRVLNLLVIFKLGNPSFSQKRHFESGQFFEHHATPCHNDMARTRVADGGDGLQIWIIAANIPNK
jgi:hypothetical protein